MKKYLFLLLTAIFCLPINANPPFNHYLQPTGAEGTNVAHEEFLTNRRKAKFFHNSKYIPLKLNKLV